MACAHGAYAIAVEVHSPENARTKAFVTEAFVEENPLQREYRQVNARRDHLYLFSQNAQTFDERLDARKTATTASNIEWNSCNQLEQRS